MVFVTYQHLFVTPDDLLETADSDIELMNLTRAERSLFAAKGEEIINYFICILKPHKMRQGQYAGEIDRKGERKREIGLSVTLPNVP